MHSARRRGFPYSENYLPPGSRFSRNHDSLEVSLDGRDMAGLFWILLGLGLAAMAIFIPFFWAMKALFGLGALLLTGEGILLLFRRHKIRVDRGGLHFGSLKMRHIPLHKVESIGIRYDRQAHMGWSLLPFVYGFAWSRTSLQPGSTDCYLRITTWSRQYSFAKGTDKRVLEWLQGLIGAHVRSLKGQRKKG